MNTDVPPLCDFAVKDEGQNLQPSLILEGCGESEKYCTARIFKSTYLCRLKQ